jgi:AraC-like DNA-binding protein
MDTLALIDTLLRGTVVALAGLLAAMLWRQRPRDPAPRLALMLCLCLVLQTLAASPELAPRMPLWTLAVLVGVSVANAVLFWGLSLAMFNADSRPGPSLLAAWLGAFVLGAFNVLLGCEGRTEPWAVAAAFVQRVLPLVCAVGAVWAAARHWRGDLVELRRQLRPLIIAAGAGYSLLQLSMRLGQARGELTGAWALMDTTLLAAVLVLVARHMLTRSPAVVWFAQPAPTERSAEPLHDADDELVSQRLHRAMHLDRIYREGDLSIAALADRLNCPEYRLRRVIRERLGHGHFNSFLNSHRIDEAQALLSDASQRRASVLSIAMAVGFQSIGPFNRAFKAATGCTPTEFRRQRLADS